LEVQTTNARKLESFLGTLDGKVDRKYWGHINLDSIVIDPDSGQVDEMSVTKEIERFKKEFPEVIRKPSGPGVPNQSPKPPSGAVSNDDAISKIVSSGLFGRPAQ
jgi:hypothetical protein